MTRALQLAHIILALIVSVAIGASIWGMLGLNRAVITLVDDCDRVVTHPVDSQTQDAVRAILASAQSIAADAADYAHQIAHPTKGQSFLNNAAKFVPKIF